MNVKKKLSCCFGLLSIFAGSPAVSASSHDWLGFHGLERQGVAAELGVVSYSQATLQAHWKVPIPGSGYSSPVVSGKKIYLTATHVTAKGTGLKKALGYVNVFLAWSLLIIISTIIFRPQIGGWSLLHPAIRGTRSIALTSVSFTLLGLCLFAPGLFSLETSVLRSWKIGTAATILCILLSLLLAGPRRNASLAFALGATLLSGLFWLRLPHREAFLEFRSVDGVICLGLVFAPAVLAWVVHIVIRRVSGRIPDSPLNAQPPAPGLDVRRVMLTFVLPMCLLVSAFWMLSRRVLHTYLTRPYQAPDEPVLQIQLAPVLGWWLMVFMAGVSLIAVVAANRYERRTHRLHRPMLFWGALVSITLGISCFLELGTLTSRKQVAYVVNCFDRDSGALHWSREVGYATTVHDYKGVNSHATPTIAISGDVLCVYFGSAGLFGLNRDGKVLWAVQDAEFDSPFGVGHSPVVADGFAILANDNEKYAKDKSAKSHIVAYDLRDGSVVWRQARDRSAPGSAGFSTPIVRTIRGQKTVLMRGWEDLTAYDPKTGAIQWSYRLKQGGGFLVAGLVADDKRVYLLDGNAVKALSLDALAEGRDPIDWILPVPGEKVSTPVLVDNLLFLATQTGQAFCIGVEEGKVHWRQKLGVRFFASMLAIGKHVAFIDEAGDASFVARSSEFELGCQHEFGEKVYASPVPMLDGLLVRSLNALYFLKPKPAGS